MQTKSIRDILVLSTLFFGLWFTAGCGPVTPVPLDVGSAWVSPKDGMVMMYVPAGEFSMGSNDGWDNEKPVHTVYLDAYWIDQTEVTNEMFSTFIDATGYETDAEKAGESKVYLKVNLLYGGWVEVPGADWNHPIGSSSNLSELDNHPVVHVSWNDAQVYCEWRGARLPTEAEWEKAAGWDDEKKEHRIYPWGNTFLGTRLNFCDKNCPLNWADISSDDGYEFTSPVGHYPEGISFYGLFDMAGNVWEWVADWHGKNYYSSSPSSNPKGPSSGSDRVLRGGCWGGDFSIIRSAIRGGAAPDNPGLSVGFRCARDGSP